MLTVTSTHLRLLQGEDKSFTSCLDSLVRAEGFVCGLTDADIQTNQKTQRNDGGIDTVVVRALPGDNFGFFNVATCWQYKAQLFKNITHLLEKEIQKPYAQELIKEGHAYRLAVCDDVDANTISKWEKTLTAVAKERIFAAAEPVRIATIGHISSWATRYPSVAARHLYQTVQLPFACFDAWGQSVATETRHFVPIENWKGTEQRIKSHLIWNAPPVESIVTLQGMAGVGKTRLVFEILKNSGLAKELVCYTDTDDKANDLIYALLNNREQRAIVVADECSREMRAKISNKVYGHQARLRVICIDNSGERLISGSQELWLDQLPVEPVQEILQRNYQQVPLDRRLSYARLCEGYIRFATFLCRHHQIIGELSDVDKVLDHIEEDLQRSRMSEADWKVLYAASLAQRVGHADEVAGELDDLCQCTGLTRALFLDSCYRLKNSPGFLAMTTRYVYVTPEIIARLAFQRAWQRWASHNPNDFLRRFPPSLLQSFQSRVRQSGSEEVRRFVGEFFRDIVTRMTPQDLADEQKFNQFAVLVETDLDRNLPILRSLVDRSSVAELRAIGGDQFGGFGGPRTRRKLVTFAQMAAAFPQYFSDAETILRRLALMETEHQIANNATATWSHLFRVVVSQTAAPFPDRLEVLKKLPLSEKQDTREPKLFAKALTEILREPSTSAMGPATFGGHRKEYTIKNPLTLDLIPSEKSSLRKTAVLLPRKLFGFLW